MDVRPRPARPRPVRTWPQRLLLGIGIAVTVTLVAAASAVAYVYLRFGDLTHLPVTVHRAPPGEPQNYLIVGSDDRSAIDPDEPDAGAFLGEDAPTGKRTDTIMVARVDPGAASISILSFPRDLWVPIATDGHLQRINTAYALGQQVLIDTIEENFDIPINHYIEVDFAGFKGLVDAIGGVPMYFDSPVRDLNTGLDIDSPGCVNLDGTQALAFARSRHYEWKTSTGWHSDGTADLGRISRQQLFVRKALGKVFETSLLDIGRIYHLIDVAHDTVAVDASLDIGDLRNLGDQFKKFSTDNLTTYSLPVVNFRTDGGASVVRLLEDKARPTLNLFRGLDPNAINEADVAVTVLNGTGAAGRAASVAGALEQIGFAIADTGNDGTGVVRTRIEYASDAFPAADLVMRHLTSGAELVEDPDASSGSVTLIVGSDFTTVMQTPFAATTTTTAPTTTTTAGTGSTTTTTAPTTTTSVVGHMPGEPPPGVVC